MRALVLCACVCVCLCTGVRASVYPQWRPPSISSPSLPPPTLTSSFKLKAIKHTRQTVAQKYKQENAQLNVCQHVNMWAEATSCYARSRVEYRIQQVIQRALAEWATQCWRRRRSRRGKRKERSTNKSRHTHTPATREHIMYVVVANENHLAVDITFFVDENHVYTIRVIVVKSVVVFFLGWGAWKRKHKLYTKKIWTHQKHLTSEQWTSDGRTRRRRKKSATRWKECGLKSFFSFLFSFFWLSTATVYRVCTLRELMFECVSGQHVCWRWWIWV